MSVLRRAILVSLFWALVGVSRLAFADAAVVAYVRGGEARVILTSEADGRVYSCQTEAGTCRIRSVEGGRMIVSAEPRESTKRGPVPRPMRIPPEGEIEIHLRLVSR